MIPRPDDSAHRSRRRRGLLQWWVLAATACVLAVLVQGFVIEPGELVERDYALAPRGWPRACDGLRVDVVADLHVGSPRNGLDHLDQVVQQLSNDDSKAVFMAGDYVILSVLLGRYVPASDVAQHLKPLLARKPVYAVLGNHDWWKGGPAVRDAFAAVGVRMVDNRATPIGIGNCRFWLVGLGDALEGKPDVPGAFARVAGDAPAIALTHEPSLFPRIPARAALTIAGHTHGGQVQLWPRTLFGKETFDPRSNRLSGIYDVDGRLLFVSPGVGTSILPIRLGVPPEISRLTLRAATAQ
ncbi:MAG TPA: metallophosphoesterase [Lysobacter sp.]|nr:metallophosphoesterase [Lysobacter sp.]